MAILRFTLREGRLYVQRVFLVKVTRTQNIHCDSEDRPEIWDDSGVIMIVLSIGKRKAEGRSQGSPRGSSAHGRGCWTSLGIRMKAKKEKLYLVLSH